MDNPTAILTALDGFLDHSVRLILYGRAALQLGFHNPPPETAWSMDVDAIIPISDLATFENDSPFWDAIERTNATLAPKGLYITHLFPADMVFLRASWESHLVPVSRPKTHRLELYRPATEDLILTKMMRGADALDLSDAEFLIRQSRLSKADLELAMNDVVLPPIPELRAAFEKARPRILALAIR